MFRRSELVVYSQPEGDELALFLTLTDLGVIDHSAKQVDGCIRHKHSVLSFWSCQKFNIPNTDAR